MQIHVSLDKPGGTALAATSRDFRVPRELAGESRKASSGMETLNDRRSMGSETLKTETASLRGIDTGRVEGFRLYFFLSAFFLLLSRNLRCPVEWLILYKKECGQMTETGVCFVLQLSNGPYSTLYGQHYLPKKEIHQ